MAVIGGWVKSCAWVFSWGVITCPSPSARAGSGQIPRTNGRPSLRRSARQHPACVSLEVYRDALYIGVQTAWPAQIWRTPDGLHWEGVITGTTETAQQLGGMVMDFAVVEDALFASTYTSGRGGAIWRTGDGLNWGPVTPLYELTTLVLWIDVLQGRNLYAHSTIDDFLVGSVNQVVTTGADGATWSVAFEPDFAVTSLTAVGDWLYAGGTKSERATGLSLAFRRDNLV